MAATASGSGSVGAEAERRPLAALPVVQAEIERLEREAARARQVRRPALEQQRVADPERALGPDRDVVRATERQRRPRGCRRRRAGRASPADRTARRGAVRAAPAARTRGRTAAPAPTPRRPCTRQPASRRARPMPGTPRASSSLGPGRGRSGARTAPRRAPASRPRPRRSGRARSRERVLAALERAQVGDQEREPAPLLDVRSRRPRPPGRAPAGRARAAGAGDRRTPAPRPAAPRPRSTSARSRAADW